MMRCKYFSVNIYHCYMGGRQQNLRFTRAYPPPFVFWSTLHANVQTFLCQHWSYRKGDSNFTYLYTTHYLKAPLMIMCKFFSVNIYQSYIRNIKDRFTSRFSPAFALDASLMIDNVQIFLCQQLSIIHNRGQEY